MCFFYSMSQKAQKVENRFKAVLSEDFKPVYLANGFNFPKMAVLTLEERGKFHFINWGLIPFWVKSREEGEKIRGNLLNARSETIFDKPSFKTAVRKRRCLVIADGFYEWREFDRTKYPYFIFFKEKALFSFAGIYEQVKFPESDEIINTFSIITTKANTLLSKIHNTKLRMPAILREEEESQWLNPDTNEDKIKALLKSKEFAELTAHPVGRLINSRKPGLSETPEVQEPFYYKELSE